MSGREYDIEELTDRLKLGETVDESKLDSIGETDSELFTQIDKERNGEPNYEVFLEKTKPKIDAYDEEKRQAKYQDVTDTFRILRGSEINQEADKEKPPLQLCGSLMLEGEQTIYFGKQGLGKTLMVNQIAMSIAEGKDLVIGDEVFINEVGSQNVLFLDFEMRLKPFAMRQGNIPFPDTFARIDMHRGGSLPTNPVELFELIHKLAQKENSKVIFIDNLMSISTLKLEDNQIASSFMTPLMNLCNYEGYSIGLVHHPRKHQPGTPLESYLMKGASVIADKTDSTWAIGEVGDTNQRYWIHCKSRNLDKIYHKKNVLVTEVIQDEYNRVRHDGLCTMTEAEAIFGESKKPLKSMYYLAMVTKHGSARRAAIDLDISNVAVSEAVKRMKSKHVDDYNMIISLAGKELDNYLDTMKSALTG